MRIRRRSIARWLGAIFALPLLLGPPRPADGADAPRPNILLILADDLGWSDLGCYGGEIRTPHLDALAAGGLRFTNFTTSARCSPSRASLLTGLHPHQVGMPNLGGRINDRCILAPQALKAAGYRRFMAGKWHLEQPGPIVRGFEEFYGFIEGHSVSFWNEAAMVRRPAGRPRRSYPPGRYYATDAIADHALDFLAEGRKTPDAPWFLYLAFNAPHFPLHAPEEDVARYESTYARGWDAIREERLARQKGLGLLPKDFAPTPRSLVPANQYNRQTGWADRENPAWDSLPADRRADLTRRMAVYAAMVDRMDRNIGRVVADLKAAGEFDRTLILFLSDNGACAEWDPFGFDGSSGPKNVLHAGDDLKTIGAPGSYISYGSGWANACNAPLRLYKHYGHEGGIASPLIAHWPAGLPLRNEIDARPSALIDVLPTLLDVAGTPYPREVDGHAILPAEGVSLAPAFRGEPAPLRQIPFEHEGNRALREGPWKLVALRGRPWELYDLDKDRGEQDDLAARHPDVVARLARAWDDWADRCDVRPRAEKPQAGAER